MNHYALNVTYEMIQYLDVGTKHADTVTKH